MLKWTENHSLKLVCMWFRYLWFYGSLYMVPCPFLGSLLRGSIVMFVMYADRGENGRAEDRYTEHGESATPDSPSLRGR